jgi:hypothetical protein
MVEGEKTGKEDWLNVLTVIGRILIAVPVGVSLVAILYFALSGGGGFTGSPIDIFIFGTIMLCGLVTLIYVAVKRFQRGLRGKD